MQAAARTMRLAKAVVENLATAAAMLGVLCFGGAAALTVANIVGRQFGLSIFGVVDLVKLLVLSGAWLAIPYAFLVDGHVSVDLFVDALPRWLRASLRVIASLVAMALLLPMFVECTHTYQTQAMLGDSSSQLGIPITWYWVPLLAGIVISIAALVVTLFARRETKASVSDDSA